MAVATISNPTTFTSFTAEVIAFDANHLVLRELGGTLTQTFFGSGFTYSGTSVTGGTVTRVVLANGPTTYYDITGLNHPATEVALYVSLGNSAALSNFLLNGNDTITSLSPASAALFGYLGNDLLIANIGNDTLDGGFGSDTLRGGAGDDLYLVDNTGDVVDETGTSGDDIVHSKVSFELGNGVEHLWLTDFHAINGTGNGLDNSLYGSDGFNSLFGAGGNDTLNGSAGDDTMVGGDGDDTYYVDTAGDVVIEAAGGGWDTVYAFTFTSYTMTVDVESLVLTGLFGVEAFGNNIDNLITGNNGDDHLSGLGGNDSLVGGLGSDTLDGGSGSDTLEGGAGDDTYLIDDAEDVIDETGGGIDTVLVGVSYALAAGLENLVLSGMAAIDGVGNEADNTLTGNAASNSLAGGAGKDTLDGGGGADTLSGGAGDDVYLVDSAGNILLEAAGGGVDTVHSLVSTTLANEIENLLLLGGVLALDGRGNSMANLITGNDGDNVLDGAGGSDTLVGGEGSDSYHVDTTSDVVIDTGFSGTDTLFSANSYDLSAVNGIEHLTLTGVGNTSAIGNALNNIITGNAGNNTLSSGGGGDQLFGAGGHDHLIGSDAMDRLDGGIGADTMEGGFGFDQYTVDDANDVVIEVAVNHSDYLDIIYSSVTYTLPLLVELLTLTGVEAIDAYAGENAGAELTGNQASNRLVGGQRMYGLAGNDTLEGGANSTWLEGGPGDDTYLLADSNYFFVRESAGQGDDTIVMHGSGALANHVEHLVLLDGQFGTGNELDNRITGNDFNNLLDGAAGIDTLMGGAGDDVYTVDNPGDVVTEVSGQGNDKVQAVGGISYTLAAGSDVEVLQLYGQNSGIQGAVGTGNELGNRLLCYDIIDSSLHGGAGNDTLEGGFFAIHLFGDADNDQLTGGTATDTLDGGTGADFLDGGDGNDSLIGGDGADSLYGNGGTDTLRGGDGDDWYYLDGTVDQLIESNADRASGGTDRVYSPVNWTLGSNFENLFLTGSGDLIGIGNALPNYMEGNAGATNYLSGGAGADTLAGGDGNDTYYVDDAGDVVIETNGQIDGGVDTVVSSVTYSAGTHIENIVFTGAAGTTGVGNGLANYIEGNAAQNYLFGGAGSDTLKGGDGNDIYYVDVSTDVVIETNALATGGTDTVVSTVTYTLGANLEQLLLSGSAATTGIGNAGANYLEGNSAQNYLSGSAGTDTMKGNDGSDVYYVDVSTDVVIETNADTVTGGVDFVVSTVTYQLGANVENLLLSGTDPITGIGSAVNNYIEGNNAANFLSGGLGADTMKGNDGNDVYYVDNTGDVVIETNAVLGTGGRDTVSSSIAYALGANVEDLLLTGNAAIGGLGNGLANYMTGNTAANALSGQDGNDTLVSGTGTDTLTGGLGADTFDFNALLDSLVGASRDIITDFSSAQGDKVDLAGIDANTLLANDQAFSFIGAAAFGLVAGQLRFAGNILAGDTDGNGVADFEVQLTGVASLAAGDLVL